MAGKFALKATDEKRAINRVLDDGNDTAGSAAASDRPGIEIERVFELGVVLAGSPLWEEIGIGPAIRRCAEQAKLTAPHETALFVMAANRLDDPVSKLACDRLDRRSEERHRQSGYRNRQGARPRQSALPG